MGSGGVAVPELGPRRVRCSPGLTGVSEATASPRTWPTPPGLGSWTHNGSESCPLLPMRQNRTDGANRPPRSPFALAGRVQGAPLTTCSASRSRCSFSRRYSALSSMAAAQREQQQPPRGRTPEPTRITPLPPFPAPLPLRPLFPPSLRRPYPRHFRPQASPAPQPSGMPSVSQSESARGQDRP